MATKKAKFKNNSSTVIEPMENKLGIMPSWMNNITGVKESMPINKVKPIGGNEIELLNYEKARSKSIESQKKMVNPIEETINAVKPLGNPSTDLGLQLKVNPTIASTKEPIAQPLQEVVTTIPKVDTTTVKTSLKTPPTIMQELDRVGKNQRMVDLSEAGFNLANIIGEATRDATPGYVAPDLSYTLQPNTRDVILNQGQQDIASQQAQVMRFMQENGIVSPGSALQANSLEAMNKVSDSATQQQNAVNAQNAQIINTTNNQQETIDAEIANKNKDRQLQINQMSGQVIGQSANNVFGIATDMNRNDLEKAKVKDLLANGQSAGLSLYGQNVIEKYMGGGYYKNGRTGRFGNQQQVID